MRVLLLSPLEGRDPLSGDTSYTRSLLDAPPPGVLYTDYVTALDDGTLRLRGRRPRHGDGQPGDGLLLVVRLLESLLRRCGLMFREPTWFAEVDPAAFDVVHLHLFALRQSGTQVPVMSSAGYPLTELYRFREGWRRGRLRLAERLERTWATRLGVHIPWLHQVTPSIMSTYSQASADHLVSNGCDPEDVRRIGTGLPDLGLPPRRPRRDGEGVRLLFVGRDFDRKGGTAAVEAFRELRRRGVEASLTVVTEERAVPKALLGDDVTWSFGLRREQVLSHVLPGCDLLLAPTTSDCGVPYALLEAMQAGLAIVVCPLPWLDDRLGPPSVTRVNHDSRAIADAVQGLLAGQELPQAQRRAASLYEAEYTMTALGEQLRSAYLDAVARRQA